MKVRDLSAFEAQVCRAQLERRRLTEFRSEISKPFGGKEEDEHGRQ